MTDRQWVLLIVFVSVVIVAVVLAWSATVRQDRRSEEAEIRSALVADGWDVAGVRIVPDAGGRTLQVTVSGFLEAPAELCRDLRVRGYLAAYGSTKVSHDGGDERCQAE